MKKIFFIFTFIFMLCFISIWSDNNEGPANNNLKTPTIEQKNNDSINLKIEQAKKLFKKYINLNKLSIPLLQTYIPMTQLLQ